MYSSLEVNPILLLIATAFAAIWVIFKWWEYRKLPPGPFGLPLVGYLPFLTKSPHKDFVKLGKKYGKIFSLSIGNTNAVMINDWEIAKQVLNHPAVLARPLQLLQLLPCAAGFASFNGAEWQEQRRFCVSTMKNLGMGRGEWETMIHEETYEFIEEVKGWEGKPKDYHDSLELSQTGNILSLLLGRKLLKDQSDPETKVLMNFNRKIMPFLSPASVLIHLPKYLVNFLRNLGFGYVNRVLKNVEVFEDLLRKDINSSEYSPSKKPTFINYYLDELKNQQKINKEHYFSMDALVGNMTALFLGAVDTTKTSLHWMLLVMAAYPEVQKKVHQEIDDVTGRDRGIYWEDRNNFPYIMATINELERWATVVPIYPVRTALETVKIGDYIIRKGTNIGVNAWALARDKKYFEDADVFKPERFLSTGNKQLVKLDGFNPFSFGKRNCPGEQVAMMTMFLYFTAIMQKFRIVCPEGKTVSFEDQGMGATRNAVLQELCFIER